MSQPSARSPVARAGLVLLLFAGAVCAQESPLGAWQVEGSDSEQRRFVATLSVVRQGGKLSFERSGTSLDSDADEVTSEVWTSREVRTGQEPGRYRVTYARADGITGALGDDEGDFVIEATYAFTADGKRLIERLRPAPVDEADWRWAYARGWRDEPTLVLEKRARLDHLFGDELGRYEASGVTVAHGKVHVAFDNSTRIGVLGPGLTKNGARLVKTDGHGASDFEGIAHDAVHDRFYLVVEADKHDGEDESRIWELSGDLELRRKTWSGLAVPSSNKGIEGLAFEAHGGEDYLLALWEGNHGKAGKRSRERGYGQIEVLRRKSDADKGWKHEATMMLPSRAAFLDYSGLDLQGDRLVVVSQTSSQVWVGRLAGDEWRVVDEGRVFNFPRERSRSLWAAVEGVAWLDERRLVVVSDQLGASDLSEPQDQSVAIFSLPE